MAENDVNILIKSLFEQAGFTKAMNAVDKLKAKMADTKELNAFENRLSQIGLTYNKAANRFRDDKGFVSQEKAMNNLIAKEKELAKIQEQNAAIKKAEADARQKVLGFGVDNKSMNDVLNSFKKMSAETSKLDVAQKLAGEFGLAFDEAKGIVNKNTGQMLDMSDSRVKQLAQVMGDPQMFSMFESNMKQLGGNTKKSLDKARKDVKKFRGDFSMEFLGVMFFGMQLQRSFTNLAKTGFSSLMKITEGAHPAAQAFNMVNASMELLKFSIGEALGTVLQTILPTLIAVITKVSDWVQQNQQLVGWLIVGGIAIGGLLFWVGQLKLGFEALGNVLMPLGTLIKGSTVWSAIVGASFGTILIWVLAVVAILAVLYAAWQSNLGGIQEFVKGTFGAIWETVKAVMIGLWEIIKTVFGIIVAIFQGDWDKVWHLTKKLGSQIFELFLKLVADLGLILYNIVAFVINIAKDIILIILKLGNKMNKIFTDIMIKVATAIENGFIKALNFVKELINDLIDKLADIEVLGAKPFAWLRNLKTEATPLADLNARLAESQESFDAVQAALQAGMDWDLPYATGDDIKAINEMIEKNNKFAQSLKEIEEANKEIAKPVVKEQDPFSMLKDPLLALQDNLGQVSSQTAVAENASQNMTDQNVAEAQSWSLKNDEMQKNIELMKELQSLTGGAAVGGAPLDLDRVLGNFASTGDVNR